MTDQPELNDQTRRKILARLDELRLRRPGHDRRRLQAAALAPGKVYFLNTQKLGKEHQPRRPADGRTCHLLGDDREHRSRRRPAASGSSSTRPTRGCSRPAAAECRRRSSRSSSRAPRRDPRGPARPRHQRDARPLRRAPRGHGARTRRARDHPRPRGRAACRGLFKERSVLIPPQRDAALGTGLCSGRRLSGWRCYRSSSGASLLRRGEGAGPVTRCSSSRSRTRPMAASKTDLEQALRARGGARRSGR